MDYTTLPVRYNTEFLLLFLLFSLPLPLLTRRRRGTRITILLSLPVHHIPQLFYLDLVTLIEFDELVDFVLQLQILPLDIADLSLQLELVLDLHPSHQHFSLDAYSGRIHFDQFLSFVQHVGHNDGASLSNCDSIFVLGKVSDVEKELV